MATISPLFGCPKSSSPEDRRPFLPRVRMQLTINTSDSPALHQRQRHPGTISIHRVFACNQQNRCSAAGVTRCVPRMVLWARKAWSTIISRREKLHYDSIPINSIESTEAIICIHCISAVCRLHLVPRMPRIGLLASFAVPRSPSRPLVFLANHPLCEPGSHAISSKPVCSVLSRRLATSGTAYGPAKSRFREPPG